MARSLEDVTSTSFSSRPSVCHTVGLRISRSNQSLTVPALNQRSRPKEGILASKPSVTSWYVEPRLPEKRCKSKSPRPTLDFERIAITILDRISSQSGLGLGDSLLISGSLQLHESSASEVLYAIDSFHEQDVLMQSSVCFDLNRLETVLLDVSWCWYGVCSSRCDLRLL